MAHSEKIQERDKAKSLAISIGIHLLLLLLFLYLGFRVPYPPPPEEGIMINFGTVEEGSGDVQPENVSEESSVPEEVPENMSAVEEIQEEVVQQDVEEAPTITTKENKKEEVTPVKEVIKEEKPKEDPKPVIDENLLFKGSKNNNSKGEGENLYKGDEGSKEGDPDAQGKMNLGLGNDGIGFDLSGRSMLLKPDINDKSQEEGKVVIYIKVDKYGKVLYAKFQQKGSTTNSPNLIKIAEEASMQAKFNAAPQAPDEQHGTISYSFKLK